VSTGELVVRSVDPGAPDVGFDYIVHGLRIGYEAYDVVRERIMGSDVPSDAYYSALYEGREDLRRYSALDRFQRMAGVQAQTVDSGAARNLREAIGERHAIADAPTEPTEEEPVGEHDPASPDSSPEPPGEETNAGFIESLLEPTPTVVGIEPTALEGDDASRPVRESQAPVEWLPVSESVETGDVLAIDLDRPGWYRKAIGAYDPAVLGIVAAEAVAAAESASAISLGDPRDAAQAPIATSGTVTCKVDAGYGEIRPGDLLTSSPTPGHAMRAATIVPGTVVGKALEGLDVGTGTIRVLVMSR